MRAEGKRYICDRCGTSAFFKKLGVESLSGGYEQYAKYESTDGWSTESGRDLCPNCWKEFQHMREMFFARVEEGDDCEYE